MIPVDMDTIRHAYRMTSNGGHWFDPASMRFFASRLSHCGARVGNRFVFTSSEQGPDGIRGYSVRVLDAGSVSTVGDFQQYDNSKQATRAAGRLVTWLDAGGVL